MFTKCGCCNGVGQVYIHRPTTGPSGIEDCSNCGGSGLIWASGIFSINFKRNDELPKTIFRSTK